MCGILKELSHDHPPPLLPHSLPTLLPRGPGLVWSHTCWGRASGELWLFLLLFSVTEGSFLLLPIPSKGYATSSLPEPLRNAPLSVCPEPLQLQRNPCYIHVFMLYSKWRQISKKDHDWLHVGLAQKALDTLDSGLTALEAREF